MLPIGIAKPYNCFHVKVLVFLAEDRGFEPLKGCPLHAFQACALGRYANPPEETNSIGALTMLRPDPSCGVTALNSPRVGIQQG